MSLNITESAVAQINKLCQVHQKLVRFSIEAGGCNGFNKTWNLDDHIADDDQIFSCLNGKLLIDPISIDLLGNATIDFVEDLNGAYFVVKIPTAKSSCGCGSSFSI